MLFGGDKKELHAQRNVVFFLKIRKTLYFYFSLTVKMDYKETKSSSKLKLPIAI